MEDLVGVFFAILIFAISTASKSQKNKKKTAARTYVPIRQEQIEETKEPVLRPAEPKAVAKMVKEQPPAEDKKMPSASDHIHEGKTEAPCPAEELRPSQRRQEKPKSAAVPGLNLKFDRNSVLQGFVMSEILNRPRTGMRR